MGRPIKKKFFGSDNVNDGLTYSAAGGEGISSITYTNRGTNYSQGLTATAAVSPIGGTSAVLTPIAVFTANGAISSATIATAGTGYVLGAAPVITLVKPANVATTITTYTASATAKVGTITGLFVGMAANVGFSATNVITQIHSGNSNIVMSGTTTGVIVASAATLGDIGSAGSLTAVLAAPNVTANTIQANAWITGATIGSLGDIVSQRSSRRYRVTNTDGTDVVRLVPTGVNGVNSPTVAAVVAANGPVAVGQMTLTAFDSDNGAYLVGKLESRTALLFPADIGGYSAGVQFTANSHARWTSTGTATENVSVKISTNA